MALSDAVAALDDLAGGRQPDWIRLAIGVASLRERCGQVGADAGVYEEAVDLLRQAPDAFAQQDNLEEISHLQAHALTLRVRLAAARGEPVDGQAAGEAAWRMVELQAQRLRAALAAGTWPMTLTPDFHFLVVALRRLRRCVAVLASRAAQPARLGEPLTRFDAALPWLARLEGIGEHYDHADGDRAREPATVVRLMLGQPEAGCMVRWGDTLVDVDAALAAASTLRTAVGDACA